MKILLSSIFSLPSTGGLWTYVTQLKKSLEAAGHSVDIFARHPNLHSFYLFNDSGTRVSFNIPKGKLGLALNKDFEKSKEVDPQILKMETLRTVHKEAIEKAGLEQYDLIHAQDILSASAMAGKKPIKTPLILTVHGCYTTEQQIAGRIGKKESPAWNYSARLEHAGISGSDFTIFPSKYMKEMYVREFSIRDKNLEIIPNGMDIQGFIKSMGKKPKPQPPDPDGKKVIACVARLTKIKGHSCLFKALKKLKEDRTDWVCWLIGDGDLKRNLKKRMKRLGLEKHIIFLGKRSDVPALLKLADICVLPSLQENCPYSIMEAQVAGRCVIASKVGGIPEMVGNGRTGYLFEKGSSRALYKQIKKLLDHEPVRMGIAREAKGWGRHQWSMERVVKQTLDVYKKGIAKKRKRKP
ncbi:glycosyltransferase family 4 protein [Neobacillus notoginsengisoli]|nr:glycosyltransferase family 4 protein [Neobacillus notoginsengisoli]